MKKMDYKHGTFTILSTSTDGFTFEDYLEYCEDNDMTPGDEDSIEFDEWCEEEADANYEADLDNIRHCKQYNIPVVITGSCGLWDGRHTIVPVVCDSVYDAIQHCFSGSIYDIDVQFSDGEILIDAYHHDGCNCFTVRALSAKGLRKQPYAGTCYDWDIKPGETKRLPYLYAI